MFNTMSNRVLLTSVLLVAIVGGVCADEIVNINPHKIVLNAQGASDDVQANIHIFLESARIVDFDATLSFDGTIVSDAESARYCIIDDILIVGFDRTELQNNPDVIDLANTTVTARVEGSVTVIGRDELGNEIEVTTDFSGDDQVEIVAPGQKKKR